MATHPNEAAPLGRDLAEPRVYIWSFPGSPIKVHIDLDVVDRIRLQISAAHPQPGGLLLGRVLGAVVHIHSVHALGTVDNASVEAALMDRAVNRSAVVGYYRLDAGDILRLGALDLE